MSVLVAGTFVNSAGVPTNGATVTAWLATRFGSPPGFNSAAPSGSPDAGPVSTNDAFGGPGAYNITLPSDDVYYLAGSWSGNTSWLYWSPESGVVSGDVVVAAGSDVNVPFATYTSDGTGNDHTLLETAATAAGGGEVWVIGTFTLGGDLVVPIVGLNLVAVGDACAPLDETSNPCATATIDLNGHAIDVSNDLAASGVRFLDDTATSPVFFKAATPPGGLTLTDCGVSPPTAMFSSDAMVFSLDHVSVAGGGDPSISLSGTTCIIRNCPLSSWIATFDCTSAALTFCFNNGGAVTLENAGTTTRHANNVGGSVTVDNTCTSTNVTNNSGVTVTDNGTTTNAQGNY